MMLDKGTAELLQQLNQNSPDLDEMDITIELAREGAKAMFLGFESPTKTHCVVQEHHVSANDHATAQAHTIPIRVYQPDAEQNDNRPLVVFIHGGGWSLGDLDCYDGLVRSLCQQSGAVFISVDYRLAPEHKFPTGLNDCLDVVNWARVHGANFNADTDRIALMGDSAGGNLALVTANKIQQQKAYSLAALYLIYPVADSASPHQKYPSREQFGGGEFLLTKEAITDTCHWYLDGDTAADHEDISPLFMTNFSHLPPTSVLLAGHDPLYDEGVALSQKLKDSGVLRRLQCFESTIHAFVSFGILPVSQEARAVLSSQIKTDLF